MSKHSILQNEVKQILEIHGWKVVENVEGRSKSGKRQESGITDLIAIKIPDVLWIEIKISPDKLRPKQQDFKNTIDDNPKFGKHIIIRDDSEQIFETFKRL